MVTLFLRQGETGKQVLLSFPVTTPAEKEDVTATMEKLRSISRTVTIQGAASEVMNLGQHLRGIDLAAEGELERINQLAERLEHMSEVDCDKFAGMLDANKISGTKDILQLTEHLDDYGILPGCSSAQSIGKYLMDCGVAPTLKQLCKNIDYEAVGQIFLDAAHGAPPFPAKAVPFSSFRHEARRNGRMTPDFAVPPQGGSRWTASGITAVLRLLYHEIPAG